MPAIPVDVLVVGAAPAGRLTALLLQRWGLRVRLVDGGVDTAEGLAPVIHARPAEALARVGVLTELLRRGRWIDDVQLRADGRVVSLALGEVARQDSPYPAMFTVAKTTLNEVLAAAAAPLVVEAAEVVSVESGADRVETVLRRTDGSTERVESGWLVGAQGALQALVEVLGVERVEREFPVRLTVADVCVEGDVPPAEVQLAVTDEGVALGLPIPRGMRMLASMAAGQGTLDLKTFSEVLSRRLGTPVTLSQPIGMRTWQLVYWGYAACRKGRCLLVGASPHFETPGNGQETNTGLLDAWSLSWMLAGVVQGWAREAVLDAYAAERHRGNAHGPLLQMAQGMFAAGDGNPALIAWVRRVMAPLLEEGAAASPVARRQAWLAASQLGHQVRTSPWVWERAPECAGPMAGDRAPDLPDGSLHAAMDGRSFTLLAASPQVDPRWPTTRPVRLAAHGPYDPRACYLIRPDGLIAVRALDPHPIDQWFTALGAQP